MQKDAIEEIRNRKKRMAICYDFDKTLSPDDMQAFTLIPSLEMDKSEFVERFLELSLFYGLSRLVRVSWKEQIFPEGLR